MIRELYDNDRDNGTCVTKVIVTDDEGERFYYEVSCYYCQEAEQEAAGVMRVGQGHLAQLEHESEAVALADAHDCPNFPVDD